MTARVELLELSFASIEALAQGDLEAANAAAEIALTPYFVRPGSASLWRMRREQLIADPTEAPWITRAILDPDRGVVVGHAGFHGPPDDDGMVEFGYSVDPQYRRQGYARASLEWLLAAAAADPIVTTVRATIGPDNEASRNLVLQYNFVEVGEQWDDEDGLEIIFEVAARQVIQGR